MPQNPERLDQSRSRPSAVRPNRYMDILFLTALEEEKFVLDQLFPTNPGIGQVLDVQYTRSEIAFDATLRTPCVQLNLPSNVTVQISWMCLEGMGNVFAFRNAYRFINMLNPRCVILLGLMAGKSGVFKRGDVGYGRFIGYSSLNKIEASSIQSEIRKRVKKSARPEEVNAVIKELGRLGITTKVTIPLIRHRKADLTEDWPDFLHVAKTHSENPDQWRELASHCFSTFQNSFQQKIAETLGYDNQKYFERDPPNASSALVASGETVIANKQVLEGVAANTTYTNHQTKVILSASAFDMESYGVGLCCDTLKIPYAVVKGISDFGGNEATQASKEKDTYRLAAITSATSFALSVVLDPMFVSYMMKILDHKGWERSACVWSKQTPLQAQGCHTTSTPSELDILCRRRPCSESFLFNVKRELLGSRVIEEVSADDYSEQLRDLLKEHTTGMDFVFPYDISDLLIFLQATPSLRNDLDKNRIDELLHGAWQQRPNQKADLKSSSDPYISEFIEIGKAAYKHLPHLRETNERCEALIRGGCSYFDVAEHFCRVMYFPFSAWDTVKSEAAYLTHIFMCGPCVPTLLLTTSSRLPHDDATYVRRPLKCNISTFIPTGPVTVCMKYSESSRLMVLASTCDLDTPHAQGDVRIFDFSREVRSLVDRCRQHPSNKAAWNDFSPFPLRTLLKNKGISLEDVYLDSDKLANQYFQKYFAEMERIEDQWDI